jgi:hypothetical protein
MGARPVRAIELGPRRFRYSGHSWHQYVHVTEQAAEPSSPPARDECARMAQNVCDDVIWLQRQYGIGYRFRPPPFGHDTTAHACAPENGCEACAVALEILRAPLAPAVSCR